MSERYADVFKEVKESIERQTEGFQILKKSYEDRHAKLEDRLEELESRASSPGKTAGASRFEHEHKQIFTTWLRKPTDPSRKNALADFEARALEHKDITIGTGAAGGFAVPEEIGRQVELLEKKFSPVRRLVAVRQTGSSDYKELVQIHGTTAGWVGETGTRTATLTSTLREVTPTHGELYAYPQASEWSLDDIFFNVPQWLSEAVAREFAIQEGEAVIRGNGTNKPTGMLNTAPVSTADDASPLRAAEAYQFVASAASPDAILPDSLITLVYTVNSAYRANGTWAMNSATLAAIRKLKDTQNQYLFQPGLIAGQPDRLLGYPIEVWEQMDDIGANKHPVAFGDFSRGYLLVDRVGLRILEDRVTNPGFVRFYVRRREGGKPLVNDAIKWIKTT
ncbi:MAG TPA: phage major capsid protein [Methylomirabilota bacterium]|nr:phage major capsid protein [Methylomirabilota bacterium]